MNERGDTPAVPVEPAPNLGEPIVFPAKREDDSTVHDSDEPDVDQQGVDQGDGSPAVSDDELLGSSRRSRRAIEPESRVDDAGVQSYRMRDFSPEGRRANSAQSSPSGQALIDHAQPSRAVTSGAQLWVPQKQDDSGDLRYYTQGTPLARAPLANAARANSSTDRSAAGAAAGDSAPLEEKSFDKKSFDNDSLGTTPLAKSLPIVIDSVPSALAPPPRPLTRRALRELETKQGLRPEPVDEQQPTAMGMTEPAAGPASEMPASGVPALIVPAQIVPAPSLPAPFAASPSPIPSAAGAPALAPTPAPAPVRTSAAGPEFAGIVRGVDLAPQTLVTSAVHWPPPAPEAGPLADGAFIRSAGSAGRALTTNALVIPSVPHASNIIRPLGSTGEILITGSIDLPRSLGVTGALSSRFDHADIDAMFAAEDNVYSSADAAPVRAIRAVSTHTSTHGVISAKKPVSNKLPMMMAVTAGILAIGVVALFTAAMIFGWF